MFGVSKMSGFTYLGTILTKCLVSVQSSEPHSWILFCHYVWCQSKVENHMLGYYFVIAFGVRFKSGMVTILSLCMMSIINFNLELVSNGTSELPLKRIIIAELRTTFYKWNESNLMMPNFSTTSMKSIRATMCFIQTVIVFND